MAESNEAIIRSVYAAWAAGDVEAIVVHCAEECELRPLRAQLEDVTYRGHDGVRGFWADLHSDWEGLDFPIEELRAEGDTVAVISRFTARGRVSGVELDVAIGQVWRLQNGLIVRMDAYPEPEDALRAAGMG